MVINYTISSGRSGGTTYSVLLYTSDTYPKTYGTCNCNRGGFGSDVKGKCVI